MQTNHNNDLTAINHRRKRPDGNGKGQMKKHYTFRPWPNAYLVQITDAAGKPLDAAARTAYQNPGYYLTKVASKCRRHPISVVE